jgi:predicted membrane protein
MNREKGLETIIVFALVSLIIYLKLDISWMIYFTICLLAISFVSNKITSIIGEIWFSFSYYLGVVMNYVIMFVFFYLILIPLSFFQKLVGNNQILKKKTSNSYFHKRHHLYTKKDIEKPW